MFEINNLVLLFVLGGTSVVISNEHSTNYGYIFSLVALALVITVGVVVFCYKLKRQRDIQNVEGKKNSI